MKLFLTFATLTILAVTASAQYVTQDAQRQILAQKKWEDERNFYLRGAQQSREAYQRCMEMQNSNSRPDPLSCERHLSTERYYNNKIAAMRPAPLAASAADNRPTAQYPGQGMFPTPGQVATGVVNGIATGQTRFSEDPNQMLQEAPVDYQSAIGGRSQQAIQDSAAMRNQLPQGGFQRYSQAQPRYTQPAQPRYTTQPYRAPIQRRPVYTAPRQQPVVKPTPVYSYPAYERYGSPSRNF